jgi:hypothetical protein
MEPTMMTSGFHAMWPMGSPPSVSMVRDSNSVSRQEDAETEREVCGPGTSGRTEGVVQRTPRKADTDHQEHQPGPEVLLALDLHDKSPRTVVFDGWRF